AKARMKFLVAKLGMEEFIRLVQEERQRLPHDPRWTEYLQEAEAFHEKPLKPPSRLDLATTSAPFQRWHRTNVRPQAQEGYSVATVFLPLGDIAAWQLRSLAQLCYKYIWDTVRTTVDQNLVIRWVSNADLPALYEDLASLELAQPGADTLANVVACPGTDSCKLGIASSRGLAAVLHENFNNSMSQYAERKDLRIKISGCFNACGQHHVADIGFFGSSRRVGQHVAPIFQVVLGGSSQGNASSFGLSMGKVSAKDVPAVVRKLTDLYAQERRDSETFADYVNRVGKGRVKLELAEFDHLPDYSEHPDYYRDNRQPWDYFMSTGVGECAGEMVSQAEFMLEDADRLLFAATLHLEAQRLQEAATIAFQAMKVAADGLLSTQGLLLSDRYDTVAEFRQRFADTGEFLPMCAEYFFRAAEQGPQNLDAEKTEQRVEEATLFVEEAHGLYSRRGGTLS
ncbi:MAG: nitrite/sulfite reductase, partial [Acidobacteria bacterium]|nr:nitrite/sulfite reductase [Acidobacteriota bacterium]